MIKVIYLYWGQKFINAPYIVKKCLLSWKLKNPSWKIIELDDNNLNDYINIEKEIPNIKYLTYTSYSDIIRIFLLEKYGGCWCDSTTFCNQSLDKWLYKNISSGFFGYYKPRKTRLVSSWFLYCEKNNYIIKKWKEETVLYFKNRENINSYFWFHNLFTKLYLSNDKFKSIFDLTPKISAYNPHYLEKKGFLDKLSNKIKNHIRKIKTPIYKLSTKYNHDEYNKKCNLYYLLNYFTIASYKITTNNLSNHIQIIANENLLKNYGLIPEIYIDRDNEIKDLNKKANYFKKIYLVMNGCHAINQKEWIPNDKIQPLFISFQLESNKCSYILNKNSLDYLKKNEPIGCSNTYTKKILIKNNIKSYVSNCLTLTLNKINTSYTGKIYISSKDNQIEKYIPNYIEYDYINHYSDTNNFDENMKSANNLLIKYSGAKLVITTFLHCALSCIGMGIPVIVFYPDSSKYIHESDKERFSGLKEIINIHTFKDIHKVNWNPKSVNISDLKENLIKTYGKKLRDCLYK